MNLKRDEEDERINLHIGKRIRKRRHIMGKTLMDVGADLNVRYQQLQKYETGVGKISAARLWELSKVLGVPFSYFFEGLEVVDGKTK